jgi:hypothetical protein
MKIAFCFLTINNLETELFYKEFFKNAFNYNIYINSKNNNNNSYFKNYVLNPSYKTLNKTDISIIYAIHYLFQKAYNDDNENSIFVFLCGNNIPLCSYKELYNKIINLKEPLIKTFDYNKKERYYQLHPLLQKEYHYNNFIKQHPNMILTREYIKLFLDNSFYIPLFKNIQCSDEHYFINILKILKKDYINYQMMFCNFDKNRTQALIFKNINIDFINYLKQNNYLFLRKINNKTVFDKKIINILYNND